ncbi:hypothetical protein QR680_008832 [Steinernema hermaphroditum]|uniref:Ig-like domain-containing protein n=1 Tax=Steinernema hermaphroditum TaxID=289476 RepID=A0AA39M8D6_9BILA|nr:hypothetical protein QR680_008832 [Steinernema hermaphroditum]
MVSRWAIIAVLLLTLTACIGSNSSELPTPPTFRHRANDPVIYFTLDASSSSRKDDEIQDRSLRCTAVGNPTPSYKWKKNGVLLDIDSLKGRVILGPGDGSLVFTTFVADDVGDYHCEANNTGGIAVSETIRLEHAWITFFQNGDPQMVSVELGDPYTKSCTPPESNPKPRVHWIVKANNGGFFQSLREDHISVNDEGTLFFHYVKETDHQINVYYTCTAENSKLNDYKFGSQFQINVTKLNRRSLHSKPIPIRELYVNQNAPIALNGRTHKLLCLFSGYPIPQANWYHNSTTIRNNTNGFSFDAKGTLTFEASMDKAGDYDCKFPANPENDRKFTVAVESAPYWVEGPPVSANVSEGETASFECLADGIPTPSVTFYRNGSPLKESNDMHVLGSKLTLYKASFRTDGTGSNAVYQCKVENKHGSLWANFHLGVLISPSIAVNGTRHKLECSSDADSNLTSKWYHNNVLVEDGANSGGFVLEENATTLVFNASSHTIGTYACKFPGHPEHDRHFVVILESKPYWIKKPPSKTDVVQGETASFECLTDGIPTPSVAFYKNGSPLKESNDTHVLGSKLTLNNVKFRTDGTGSNAVYQCKAENKHGIASTVFNVVVQRPHLVNVWWPVPVVFLVSIVAVIMAVVVVVIYVTKKHGDYQVSIMELERGREKVKVTSV